MPTHDNGLWRDDFIDQFAVQRPRKLWAPGAESITPRILVSILAKQAAVFLPLYLECLERQTYPKNKIYIYIRTNNNSDSTEQLLRDWVSRVGENYERVEMDSSDVAEKVETFKNHEWNERRFQVLGNIRNVSLQKAIELNCDFYFCCDVDNFIIPSTLQELVGLQLPIVAPLLRFHEPNMYYSNFWTHINEYGYYEDNPSYYAILSRAILGIFEVALVHHAYMVRSDVIKYLSYANATSSRYEFMIFSDSARNAGIPQYVDNRQVYGYILEVEPKEYESDGISKYFKLMESAWR